MRRRILVLGALVLFAGFALAQNAPKEHRFEPAQVVSTVDVSYPITAVWPGTVVLEVTVEPTGEVGDVKVVQDAKGFTPAALSAIKKWKFKPATLDGEPVRSRVPVAFAFSQPAVWWPR